MVCSLSARGFNLKEIGGPSARAFNSEHQVSVIHTLILFVLRRSSDGTY